MTPAAALALELELDRAEGALDPAWLVSATAARLAARAAASGEPALMVRGRVLGRWALAARVDADPAVVAARRAGRDLEGLAVRHAALRAVARRLGFATVRALIEEIHGALPAHPSTRPPASLGAHGTETETETEKDAGAVIARLAAVHGLETAGIDLRTGAASATVTLAPGHARVTIGPAVDALAKLALTMHEAGHALYRAQQGGMSLLASAPPARWFDEAIAAWAVRALEDPAIVADPALRRAAATRRRRREHVTERLAAFEAQVLDHGTDITAAWRDTGLRDPAAYPGLFDEPGLMASYEAADTARLDPKPGELRAWARAGAARALP